MSVVALNIPELSVAFDEGNVISDFSLTMEQGEILCLLGPSGCGKTTVLKSIAGLLDQAKGEIQVFNQTVLNSKIHVPAEKRNIGFIFQDYALFPHMTVHDNIEYGISHLPNATRQQRVEESLELVELGGLGNRFPHELSGGQQQRVTVARALACKPRLLLMDEPFSNIDSQVKRRMMTDLKRLLKEHDITAIFVTHTKSEAFAFADRIAVMHGGKLQQLGSPKAIFETPNSALVANLMESGNVIPADRIPNGFNRNVQKQEKGFYLFFPSHVDIQLCNNGGEAVIIDKQYIGNGFEYEVQFDERIWRVRSKDVTLNFNDMVNLSYHGEPLWLPE